MLDFALKVYIHSFVFLQVSFKREKLLKHPLVTFLLLHKWRRYGRHVYYANFTFYMIFLLFLTGYALVTSEKFPPELEMSIQMSHEQVHDNLHFHIVLCSSENIIKALTCYKKKLQYEMCNEYN